MKTEDIVAKIDAAKNHFGVVTHDSVRNELNGLTAGDWRQASQIFSKNAAASNDGFYIDDSVDGKVTIHNNMNYAHQIADNTVLKATMEDAKYIAGAAAAATGLFSTANAAATGLALWAPIFGSSAASTGAEAMSASAAALGTAALYVGGFAGAVGAVVLAGDAARNYHRKQDAAKDILDNTDVKF